MPAVGQNVSRSAHVSPGHQDTIYSPHGPFAPALNLSGVVFEWPFGKQSIPSRGSNAGLQEVQRAALNGAACFVDTAEAN